MWYIFAVDTQGRPGTADYPIGSLWNNEKKILMDFNQLAWAGKRKRQNQGNVLPKEEQAKEKKKATVSPKPEGRHPGRQGRQGNGWLGFLSFLPFLSFSVLFCLCFCFTSPFLSLPLPGSCFSGSLSLLGGLVSIYLSIYLSWVLIYGFDFLFTSSVGSPSLCLLWFSFGFL